MPLPKPGNENRSEFMQRCMDNSVMRSEFPDPDQRYAVCNNQWDKSDNDDFFYKKYQARNWVTTDRYRGQFRRKYRKVLRKALDYSSKPLFDLKFESVGEAIAMLKSGSLIQKGEIFDAYYKMIPDIALFFAKLDWRKAKAQTNEIEVKSPITGLRVKEEEGEKIMEDIWMAQFQDFVEKDLGTKIVSVWGETRNMHIKFLEDILKENPNMSMSNQFIELKDKLKEKYILNRRWRLNRIIRTETSFASNYGSMTGMNSTGKNYEKTWIASFSGNTRKAHSRAHNQTVKKNEPFRVMGEELMYPCDLHGSAENVINCKCTTSYQVVR